MMAEAARSSNFWPHVLYLLALATAARGTEAVTIHGGWSPWTNLETDCVRINETSGEILDPSVKCGGGVTLRTRSCTNPVPQVYIQ